MRLFLAIPPDRELRRGLTAMQDALRALDVRGNYTPAENLHLTLAFIGDFDDPDAVITAVETRSSSPVRIRRDENGENLSVSGIYPTGEGAGYAGGIMSSAIDGIRQAEVLLDKLFS